jgi:Cu/Ag efflux pump CusA
VLEASLEMRRPLGYATLILAVAMVPVFFTGGRSGAFVHPLALAYGLAVIASMLVALTITPALTLLVYSRPPRTGRESPVLARLTRTYEGAVSGVIRTRRPALFTLGAVLLVGLVAVPFLSKSLHPSFKDRELLVKWDATPSTSLPEMERITSRATTELSRLPGVSNISAHVGRAVTSDTVSGPGSGEMWLTVDKDADYDKTLASVRNTVNGYAGLHGSVLTYETDRSQDVLSRPDNDLLVRVYGQSLDVLHREATKLQRLLASVPGVRSPRVQSPIQQPTMQIKASLAKSRQYNIKPGDVRRATGILVSGLEVGSFFEEQKVFQVVVRGVPHTRNSITSVRNMLIDTPSGGHVRVGDVASVTIKPNPVDIRHEGVSRYMDVRAAVSGRDLSAVQSDVRNRMESLSFPLEYHAEVLDQPEDTKPNPAHFLALVLTSLLGIFLLLQAAFASWRLSALVSVTLPMALVGGVLVVLASGGDLSLGAAFGLFTVFGIAVRNAVKLVTRFQRLEDEEGQAFGPRLVQQGARERFAPVVATAVTTALALAPFAVLGDIAGNEITHSAAVVTLGGLVTSTLLTLFVLPALYLHFGSSAPATARARTSSAPATAEVDVNA